mgnify:FL=1|jgi:FKBP-type peptidyl-prolyl cis-trans isomerase SlyD
MITNQTVVTCIYDLYVDGENGKEELMEKATIQHPLVYCHGEGMMLPAFEAALEGKSKDEHFDFTIACEDAYGEYDPEGLKDLPKHMFYNGDGEFDESRVFVGNIIPMTTVDGQIINAQVVEITEDCVTIDLNHPLAGENLHFVGQILDTRIATEAELDAIRNPHRCGGCKGNCGDCGGSDACNGDHSCGGECHCEH